MTISRMALMGRPCMPCSCKQRAHAKLKAATEHVDRRSPSPWDGSGPAAAACLWCTSAAQQSSKTERPTVGSNSTRPGLEPEPRRSCMAVRTAMRAAKCYSCASAASHEKYGRPSAGAASEAASPPSKPEPRSHTELAASHRPRRPITPPFTPRGVTRPPRSGGLW